MKFCNPLFKLSEYASSLLIFLLLHQRGSCYSNEAHYIKHSVLVGQIWCYSITSNEEKVLHRSNCVSWCENEWLSVLAILGIQDDWIQNGYSLTSDSPFIRHHFSCFEDIIYHFFNGILWHCFHDWPHIFSKERNKTIATLQNSNAYTLHDMYESILLTLGVNEEGKEGGCSNLKTYPALKIYYWYYCTFMMAK